MSFPPSFHRFPTAILAQQIAYVTDNDRDAEAVSFEIDCPVVEDGSTLPFPVLHSPIVIRKHSGRLDTRKVRSVSDVSNVPNIRGVSDVRNLWEVSKVSNVREVPEVSKVPNIRDGSNVSNLPEVREASDAPNVRDVPSRNL